MKRHVEVYTGAYASGKSEISINRALMLGKQDKVTLVDLDTVEPAYTLRPIKKDIEKFGIDVITQEDYFGLGETGNTITPNQMNCFSTPGTLVIDVGYGVGGLDILNVLQGIELEEDLNLNIVINTSKPETSTVDNIVEYVNWSKGTEHQEWKKFTGIISNTHLSDETTKEDVLKGFEKVSKASKILDIPIVAITMGENLVDQFTKDEFGEIPIWGLNRYMPKALW